MVRLGLTEPFSDFVRKLADWFVLTMVTGFPWGLGPYDPRIKVKLFLFFYQVKIVRNLTSLNFQLHSYVCFNVRLWSRPVLLAEDLRVCPLSCRTVNRPQRRFILITLIH